MVDLLVVQARTRRWFTAVCVCSFLGCYAGAAEEEQGLRDRGEPWAGESGNGPPPTHSSDEDVLRETSMESPPADSYDFVGYVRMPGLPFIHDVVPHENVGDLLRDYGVELGDPDQGLRDPPIPAEEHDVGRSLALSADGRLFIEKEDVFRKRLLASLGAPESGASFMAWENGPPNYDDDLDPSDDEETLGHRSGIHGSDSRKYVGNSEAWPHRAVGVQTLTWNGGSSYFYDADASFSRRGSGTMISPRALATAAHVILKPNGDIEPQVVAPGAKSRSLGGGVPRHGIESTEKFPWGGRRVKWYHWPVAYGGYSDWKYDYGVMVLYDLDWNPGHIRVGHQSTSWLNFRAFNMSGYPAAYYHCADSPFAGGDCDGAQYRVLGDVRDVWSYTARTWLDTQPGQSGSGIYFKRGEDRVLYLINVGSCDDPIDCGLAKRLTSGSRGTICNWMESWPSIHFDNPNC